MSDDGILSGLLLVFAHEFLCARKSHLRDVLDDFLIRHPDAGVGDGDGLFRGIDGDVDPKLIVEIGFAQIFENF